MKFEFSSADQGFKKGVLFLSGRGKSIQSWNQTSTGKTINLESDLRKRVQTCSVEFDETDLEGYLQAKVGNPQEDTTLTPLIQRLDPKVKWLVVAHSMGAYFASLLPEKLLSGIILIDPVRTLVRTDFKTPVRVHLKVDPESSLDFELFSKLTAYHSHSALIVHWGSSHMIHWDHSDKIRVSIDELLRLK